METKANYVWVGAFTIAAIVGAFLAVLFFSGAGRMPDGKTYQVTFTGSVSGLTRGGAVLFNGLRVGEVTGIDFLPDDPGHVAARIAIERRVPVRADTKARLELQGVTGVSAIALMGGARDAAPLEGANGAPPVIVAEPSQIESLLRKAEILSARADAVLAKADRLISDNGAAITDTLHNIDAVSKALADNSAAMSAAAGGVAELGREIGPLSGRVDKLIAAIDPDEIRRALDDLAAFTKSLGDDKGSAQSLLKDSAELAKRLNGWSGHVGAALDGIENFLEALDPRKVIGLSGGAGEPPARSDGPVTRMWKTASNLAWRGFARDSTPPEAGGKPTLP